MLSKLIKYDFKATSRIFLPLYAVLISFAVINKIISSLSNDITAPEVISMVIFNIIFTGTFAVTFVVLVQRFYKNLLTDEGYLMFTLPTKPWKHIISKLLVSMIWIISSTATATISILILISGKVINMEAMYAFFISIGEFFNRYGLTSLLYIIELLLIIFMILASSILIIFASIALGHLFNKHRIIWAIVAFLALSTITQILFVIVASISNTVLDGLTFTIPIITVESFAHLFSFFIITLVGLPAVGYFAITNYILSNRLNLE